MPSDRLGFLRRDLTEVQHELLHLPGDAYSDVYNEYSVGDWSTATLWNEPDPPSDGSVREHRETAVPTAWGRSLAHTNDLICRCFELSALRAVRAFRARLGAIIIPHRDYLEHPTGFTRIHVPVVTSQSARNSELDAVYHMSTGEVWFLDGRVVHSGGVLGPADRIHLVFDFDSDLEDAPSKTLAVELEGLPPFSAIRREPVPKGFLDGILLTASCLRLAMWPSLVELLARIHLVYETSVGSLYDWLDAVAHESGRKELEDEAARMRRYFLTDGPSRTPTFCQAWASTQTSDGVC
ncbi:MAG: aspartyl/asparaginyl beta-hydroxylase domain-containing protein [Actinomycetota bacterium]